MLKPAIAPTFTLSLLPATDLAIVEGGADETPPDSPSSTPTSPTPQKETDAKESEL
jgi:hypothetical protein